MLRILLLGLALQPPLRTIAIDERLAADARIGVGDTVVIAAAPEDPGDTVQVAAIVRRGTDPAEVALKEYRIRMHLTHLQELIGYGDRVDRFAVGTLGARATDDALARINSVAFGFRAHRSIDIAVETSRTFQVVSRFHRAIGVITILASAIFLLCIMLLKVEERRRDVAALRLLGVSRRTVLGAIVLEASLIALLGSAMGAALGAVMAAVVNWHYQGVYRTPLSFAIVTPGLLAFSVVLSLLLGIAAGAIVGTRLVRTAPLELFGR